MVWDQLIKKIRQTNYIDRFKPLNHEKWFKKFHLLSQCFISQEQELPPTKENWKSIADLLRIIQNWSERPTSKMAVAHIIIEI